MVQRSNRGVPVDASEASKQCASCTALLDEAKTIKVHIENGWGATTGSGAFCSWECYDLWREARLKAKEEFRKANESDISD